jgi:ribosomal protein L11 methyltransferase
VVSSTSTTSRRRPAFARLVARFADVAEAERAAVRAYDAGALGLEERSDERGVVTLLLYAPAERAAGLRAALAGSDCPPLELGEIEPVPDTDWSEGWKAGFGASVISKRLLVRPSWVAHPRAPGQIEVVIDPGQAFGTGTHPSTRLALEWIDQLAGELPAGARLLDVGTGSGVLALAAVLLAPVRAIAFDLDPVAAREARDNAVRNDRAVRVSIFAGSLDAVAGPPFDLVVANLLRSEALPLLPGLAACTRAGGRAVFSGLLDAETEAFSQAAAAVGLAPKGVRRGEDASGERWAALLTVR